MGVKGLWKLLECTGRPISPETLEGKILAVDISIWLNQAVKGIRNHQGNAMQNGYLLVLFHRLCKLLFFKIRPVFVFDGEAPLLKKHTLAKRKWKREVAASGSKKTTEKLRKTLLKRQIIKTALTGKSGEPVLSLSQVQRDEIDDIYMLPPSEEREKNSEEEDEKEWEERMTQKQLLQEEFFMNPHSVNIESEDFSCLPLEVKHEILTDMKEFTKHMRTLSEPMPEESNDFSLYQLKGLLKKNSLNVHIESIRREMNKQFSGDVQTECEHRGGFMKDVETRRLVSEDASHYILMTGIKRKKADAEEIGFRSLPSRLPGYSICKKNLSKTNISKKLPSPDRDSKMDRTPPPRTVLPIQETLLGNCSEEGINEKNMSLSLNLDSPYPPPGEVHPDISPRTLQAIHKALSENDENDNSSTKRIAVNEEIEVHSSRKQMLLVNSSDEDEEALEIKGGQEPQFCFHSSNTHFTHNLEVCHKDTLLEKIISSEECRTQGTNSLAIEKGDFDNKPCCPSGNDGSIINEALPDTGNTSKPVDSFKYIPLSGITCIETNVCTRNAQSECMSKTNPQIKREPLKLIHLFPGELEVCAIPVKNDSSKHEESDSDGSFIEVEVDSADLPMFCSETLKTLQPTHDRNITAALTKTVPVLFMNRASSNADIINNTSEDGALTEQQQAAAGKEKDAIMNEWQDINMEELESMDGALSVQQTTLEAQREQQERNAATVTGQMCLESQELLRLFGIPYIVSPMEAEAQCAMLDLTDQTSGTITDDSDIWLFGARHVYKNVFSQNKYIEYYQSVDIKNQLGLDRNKLINLAYLVGSDYTEGIPTVGCVTAMEILNEFPGPGMEPLVKFTKWWTEAQKNKKMRPNPHDTKVKRKLHNLELYPSFPNMAIAEAYLKPVVDDSHGTFSWGTPNLEQIKEFCESHFGWYQSKTEKLLLPLLRQLNVYQSQLQIDSFFGLEQHEKQAIKSQRLRRAVTCMLRKAREEDAGKEEETVALLEKKTRMSKKRKGKRPVQTLLGKLPGDNRLSEKRKRFSNIRQRNANCGNGAFLNVPQLSKGFPVRNSEGKATDMNTSASTSQEPEITTRGEKDTVGLKPWQGSDTISSSSGEDEEKKKKVMVTARSIFGNKKEKSKYTRGRKKI